MISDLIDNFIWPLVFLASIYILREPLSRIICALRGMEYIQNKDGKIFRLIFDERMKEVKQNLEILEGNGSEEYNVPDPKAAIIQAWDELEAVAHRKLQELNINVSDEGFKNTALIYLEYKGALSPKVEAAIQDMRMLRNQLTHYPSSSINQKEANSYINSVKKIEKLIDGLEGLPGVQLHAITMITRNLVHLIDTGKYAEITIGEIHGHIEAETILDFVSSLEGAEELKGAMQGGLWQGFVSFYTKSLKSIYYGYAGDERRRWGIENSGICLLLAWTNEIVQMGSGWHPNENLSELNR